MLGAHEGDIVDDEDAGLGDRGELGGDPLRGFEPVAAVVEGPGAAEGAVPGTAAGELDRGRRVERADEIAAAMAKQVPRRKERVEIVDEDRPRPLALRRDRARHGGERAPGLEGREEGRKRRLALALEHAVDRAVRVGEERGGDERGAVAADHDRRGGEVLLRGLGQIDDLGDVGEVVAGEDDHVRAPAFDQPMVMAVGLHLQIEQADIVPRLQGSGGDQLQPQRLEPEEDPRVHQRARVDTKHPNAAIRHRVTLL